MRDFPDPQTLREVMANVLPPSCGGEKYEVRRSHASTPFHPPYDGMRKVMRDVTAGLLELCVSVAEATGSTSNAAK
jgi:hypothetical protein